MDVKPLSITIMDLFEGYLNNDENGVLGFSGRLDIRPAYQREFVYKDKQRDEVIRSVMAGLPLNVMYWADNGAEKYEIIDGQQRTISICSYLDGDFPVDDFYFENLQDDVVAEILGYPLMVYACSGTASEKLKWFEIVNIAGEKLTPQELRNAVYSGPWVTDAKRYFSKSGCLHAIWAKNTCVVHLSARRI